MSLKRVSNNQSSQPFKRRDQESQPFNLQGPASLDVAQEMPFKNSPYSSILNDLRNRNVGSARNLQDAYKIENEIQAVSTNAEDPSARNEDDCVILSFTALPLDKVDDAKQLIKMKKIESELDNKIFDAWKELISKEDPNLFEDVESASRRIFEKEIQDCETIVNFLESVIEKDLQKYFELQNINSEAFSKLILNLKNYNVQNSLEASGENHDNNLISFVSKLTSVPARTLEQLDNHSLVWLLLSDIKKFADFGITPGYIVEQGSRSNILQDVSNRGKFQQIPSFNYYKEKLIEKSNLSLGGDTDLFKWQYNDALYDILPNLNLMEPLEKVAYYCTLICNELKFSLGRNISFAQNFDGMKLQDAVGAPKHYNEFAVRNNNQNSRNQSANESLYSFLFLNDSGIENSRGLNNFLYSNPLNEKISYLPNTNFAFKNYVQNFLIENEQSPGKYEIFHQANSAASSNFSEFFYYIKYYTLQHRRNDIGILNPSNIFESILQKFFNIAGKAINQNDEKLLQQLIVDRNLQGNPREVANNLDIPSVRWKSIKQNRYQKSLEYFKQNSPSLKIDDKSPKEIGRITIPESSFSIAEIKNYFSIEDLHKSAKSETQDEFVFAKASSDILNDLIKKIQQLTDDNPISAFDQNKNTSNSNFNANMFLTILLECFYILCKEYVNIKWETNEVDYGNVIGYYCNVGDNFFYIDPSSNYFFMGAAPQEIERKTNSSNNFSNTSNSQNRRSNIFDNSNSEVKNNNIVNTPTNRNNNIIIDSSILFACNEKYIKKEDVLKIIYGLKGEEEAALNLFAAAKSVIDVFYEKSSEIILIKNNFINANNSALAFLKNDETSTILNNLNQLSILDYKKNIENIKKNYEIKNYNITQTSNLKKFDMAEWYLSKIQDKENKFLILGYQNKIIDSNFKLNRFKLNVDLTKINNLIPNKNETIKLARQLNISFDLDLNEVLKVVNYESDSLEFEKISKDIDVYNIQLEKIQKLPVNQRSSNSKLIESLMIENLMNIIFGFETQYKSTVQKKFYREIIQRILTPVEKTLGVQDLLSVFFVEENNYLKLNSNKISVFKKFKNKLRNKYNEIDIELLMQMIYPIFDNILIVSNFKNLVFSIEDNSTNSSLQDYNLQKRRNLYFRYSEAEAKKINDLLSSYIVSSEIVA